MGKETRSGELGKRTGETRLRDFPIKMRSCVTGLIKKTQGPDPLWLNTLLRTKHYCVNENIKFGLFTQKSPKSKKPLPPPREEQGPYLWSRQSEGLCGGQRCGR